MRSLLLALGSGFLVVCCALTADDPAVDSVPVLIQLVDADSGEATGGMVRAFAKGAATPLRLPDAMDRLRGLSETQVRSGWFVVPADGLRTTLPTGTVRLEAMSGLESGRVVEEQAITSASKGSRTLTLRLPMLFRPEQAGWIAGNTHLHLRNMTLDEANDYLNVIPPADRLRVLFISYLERVDDDRSYITNEYPIGSVDRLTGTGVLYNNGEEHRHNFEAYGQGYGHVMFLNLKELVTPVSLGPGITGAGFDDRPLAPGIRNAREQNATVIWCHDNSGYEFLPQLLSGHLDALNVFDGSQRGSYADRYYRCLNIGLRLPISTGTDWFLYDFSRVYTMMSDKPVSIDSWLAALRHGRSVATNGPMLTLTVNDQPVGSTLQLAEATEVPVRVEAVGREDFGTLQLVRNGEVIAETEAVRDGSGFVAHIDQPLRMGEPCWLAARIDTEQRNEFDMPLFAHTSPIVVEVGTQRVFRLDSARELLAELEQARETIAAKGSFSTAEAGTEVLRLYDSAIATLTDRINRRGQ